MDASAPRIGLALAAAVVLSTVAVPAASATHTSGTVFFHDTYFVGGAVRDRAYFQVEPSPWLCYLRVVTPHEAGAWQAVVSDAQEEPFIEDTGLWQPYPPARSVAVATALPQLGEFGTWTIQVRSAGDGVNEVWVTGVASRSDCDHDF